MKGHKPFSVYDGLYKNSFFLFTRDPNPDEHLPGPGSAAPLPNILCCSVISDKKIKIDDVHSVEDGASRIQERDARKCLQAIDNSFLAPKRNADDELIRTFEYGLFSCTSAENLAKQMCVFLVLTMEMELIGYEILTAGNISGR